MASTSARLPTPVTVPSSATPKISSPPPLFANAQRAFATTSLLGTVPGVTALNSVAESSPLRSRAAKSKELIAREPSIEEREGENPLRLRGGQRRSSSRVAEAVNDQYGKPAH